jgi:hypothetical protein
MLGCARPTMNGTRQFTPAAGVVLLVIFMVSGCGPKKPVHIPEEWRLPPPPTQTVPKAPGPKTKPARPKPVLPPAPKIEEKDLSVSAEKPRVAAVTPSVPSTPSMPGTPGASSMPGAVTIPKTPAGSAPQELASLHLVSSAITALDQNQPDQAISQLEQAIEVNAYSAEAFYYLAKAWQAKGDYKRALEFARKSEILSQEQPRELKRAYLLESELLRLSNQLPESEVYRQKAARLGM